MIMEGQENEIFRRLIAVETLVQHTLASREWVREELRPIREISLRTEAAIGQFSEKMSALAQELTSQAKSQDAFLRQSAQNEASDHADEQRRAEEKHQRDMALKEQEYSEKLRIAEENSFMGIIERKWKPILGVIATAVGTVMVIWEHFSPR